MHLDIASLRLPAFSQIVLALSLAALSTATSAQESLEQQMVQARNLATSGQ